LFYIPSAARDPYYCENIREWEDLHFKQCLSVFELSSRVPFFWHEVEAIAGVSEAQACSRNPERKAEGTASCNLALGKTDKRFCEEWKIARHQAP